MLPPPSDCDDIDLKLSLLTPAWAAERHTLIRSFWALLSPGLLSKWYQMLPGMKHAADTDEIMLGHCRAHPITSDMTGDSSESFRIYFLLQKV